MTAIPDDYQEVYVPLASERSLALPPEGHRITSVELLLLVRAGTSVAPNMGGMDVVGVLIVPDDCLREHMRQASPPAEIPTFLGHIGATKDKHIGLFPAIVYLALNIAYHELNATPDLVKEAWKQVNALLSSAVQRLMQIPGSADLESFVAAESFTNLVIPPPRHRTEVHVTHWSESVEVTSAAHRTREAFVWSATKSLLNLLANVCGQGASEFCDAV